MAELKEEVKLLLKQCSKLTPLTPPTVTPTDPLLTPSSGDGGVEGGGEAAAEAVLEALPPARRPRAPECAAAIAGVSRCGVRAVLHRAAAAQLA
eukprot:8174306-Pyramimonas_sp.AAC.1